MSKGPPLRLRDDPAIGRALREDLARAATHAGGGYDVAAGLAKLEQTLNAGPGAGAGAGAGGKLVLGAALKGALLGVAVLGGAALLADRSPAPPPPAPVASLVAPVSPPREERAAPAPHAPPEPPTPPPPRAIVTKPLPVEAPVTRVATSPPAEAAPAPPIPAVAPAAAATSAGDPLAAEVAHLARLRALQDGDPAAALAVADEGNRRFPGGLFAQEREAIAVGALARLGRTAEARARARSFLASYPRSSFAERIEKLTGIGGAR